MADIEITDRLGFYVLTPVSDAGREWVDAHVQCEDWQRLGPGIGIDSGDLVAAIAQGATEDGLEVV